MKGADNMKTWAEQRMQDMESVGAFELAQVFELVAKICDLDEQLISSRSGRTEIRPDLVVDGTNTVPYLHRGVRGERIVGTVGAGLVPDLGTHKGCPYNVAEYVTVLMRSCT
jgi:hypothetical protein